MYYRATLRSRPLTYSLLNAKKLSSATVTLTSHQDLPGHDRGDGLIRGKYGVWGESGMGKPPYQITNVKRVAGVDLSLQERLDQLFHEVNERKKLTRDLGLPPKAELRNPNRPSQRGQRGNKRQNAELERAARTGTLKVSPEEVSREHKSSGAALRDVKNAAELYGIFEDLFAEGSYFNPVVDLVIEYDLPDGDSVLPVFRGNVIKPAEAAEAPRVRFRCDESGDDSLWTLVLSNPDGCFTHENAECLHWMVSNIPNGGGDDLSKGDLLCDYLRPLPPSGTGFHRMVFTLYKQKGRIDLSKSEGRPDQCRDLQERHFSTQKFLESHRNVLTPAGLAFFQSDWDSSLRRVFHDELNMREPKFEYDFVPPASEMPWNEYIPHQFKVPFNIFLDNHRDPKEIQEELVLKKLKEQHPFRSPTADRLKYPNAHTIDPSLPSWRRRELEKERLKWGIYKDLDWAPLRRDPSYA